MTRTPKDQPASGQKFIGLGLNRGIKHGNASKVNHLLKKCWRDLLCWREPAVFPRIDRVCVTGTFPIQ